MSRPVSDKMLQQSAVGSAESRRSHLQFVRPCLHIALSSKLRSTYRRSRHPAPQKAVESCRIVSPVAGRLDWVSAD